MAATEPQPQPQPQPQQPEMLTAEQLQTFLQDGVLVVENVLSQEELADAVAGLEHTLATHQVDPDHLAQSGHHLRHLSSTNGSGGVLDLFYEDWKLKLIAANSKLFAITTELWKAAYCHNNEDREDLLLLGEGDNIEQLFKWHPYGAFDCHKGYMYIDRIGYRLPTKLAKELGAKARTVGTTTADTSVSRGMSNTHHHDDNKKKAKKSMPIQRSLTPHLDCCPSTFFMDPLTKTKWRPIQCFVALTDALEPDTGGYRVDD